MGRGLIGRLLGDDVIGEARRLQRFVVELPPIEDAQVDGQAGQPQRVAQPYLQRQARARAEAAVQLGQAGVEGGVVEAIGIVDACDLVLRVDEEGRQLDQPAGNAFTEEDAGDAGLLLTAQVATDQGDQPVDQPQDGNGNRPYACQSQGKEHPRHDGRRDGRGRQPVGL